jgi:simple sugar transport system substrate-binding protein/ribose transport system substrate-binding protein
MGMAALLVLGIAGCNKPAEGDNGKTTTDNGGKKLKIAGVIFQNDQFFQLVKFGMQDAADKAGVEILMGNSDGKADKESTVISTYANAPVDALVISPLSKTGSVKALEDASKKGIKIICYNTAIKSDFVVTNIVSDEVNLGMQTGKEAVKFINEKLGGKANIAVLAFKSQVPEQSDSRCKGFLNEVTKLPGVKIVSTQDAWLSDMAVKKVGDILTANPNVNLIWAANEGGTDGAVLAVRAAGKAGKIFVFGTDSSEMLISHLENTENILQAITSQRPVEIGSKAVEYAIKALKGETVPKEEVLEGTCIKRSDPEGVKTFKEQLKKWMGK